MVLFIFQITPYLGASVNPFLPATEYEWWLREAFGVCKTVSVTGEIVDQDCTGTSLDNVIRKPLCQLGMALDKSEKKMCQQ